MGLTMRTGEDHTGTENYPLGSLTAMASQGGEWVGLQPETMTRKPTTNCRRHCASPELVMARSFEHGVQIEAQTPVAISKGGQRPTTTDHVRTHINQSSTKHGVGFVRRRWPTGSHLPTWWRYPTCMGIARYWQHSPVSAHLAASRLFLAPEPLLLTTLLVLRSVADIGRSTVAGLGFVCGTCALHASIGNRRIVCL
jgi:hypothetical protein